MCSLMIDSPDDIRAIEARPFEQHVPARSVYQMLCDTAAAQGDAPGVSFQLTSGPRDPATTRSWPEVLADVNRLANALRAEGVGPGDVVAFLLPNLPETVTTLLAGTTVGIVAPINPLLEPEQISSILRETGAKVLITLRPFPRSDLQKKAALAARHAPDCKLILEIDMGRYLAAPKSWLARLIAPRRTLAGAARVLSYHRFCAAAADKLTFDPPDDPQTVCAYFHTGGTTGLPKVAVHRHIGAIYNGWLAGTAMEGHGRNLLCPLPLFHVFGAYPMLMSRVLFGGHFIMPTPAGYRGDGVIANFWKLLARWQVHFFCTVPTAVSALMQVKVDADISQTQFAICGSATMPTELFKRFEATTGIDIAEGYGQTECTCLISCNPVKGDVRIGSVGPRFPFTQIAIIDTRDDAARHVAQGEVGEICIRSPGVISGYLEESRNKGLTTADGWLRSGDLGRLDENGYLWITGRAKDIIIRGGHNIDPAVIEDALHAHPGVAMAGAIGQPDAYAGETPCAYVELVAGAQVDGETLRAFAAERVSERAARPVHVEVLDELPKTAVGKIFKPPLRAMAISRVYGAALEKAAIAAEVLVEEDRKLGQVALIRPLGSEGDEQEIDAALNAFTRPWRLVGGQDARTPERLDSAPPSP